MKPNSSATVKNPGAIPPEILWTAVNNRAKEQLQRPFEDKFYDMNRILLNYTEVVFVYLCQILGEDFLDLVTLEFFEEYDDLSVPDWIRKSVEGGEIHSDPDSNPLLEVLNKGYLGTDHECLTRLLGLSEIIESHVQEYDLPPRVEVFGLPAAGKSGLIDALDNPADRSVIKFPGEYPQGSMSFGNPSDPLRLYQEDMPLATQHGQLVFRGNQEPTRPFLTVQAGGYIQRILSRAAYAGLDPENRLDPENPREAHLVATVIEILINLITKPVHLVRLNVSREQRVERIKRAVSEGRTAEYTRRIKPLTYEKLILANFRLLEKILRRKRPEGLWLHEIDNHDEVFSQALDQLQSIIGSV